MLKNMGMHMSGGNLDSESQDSLRKLIITFEELLEESSTNLPAKLVRPKLPGSIFVLKDPVKIVLVYTPKDGVDFIANGSDHVVLPTEFFRAISLERDADDLVAAILPLDAEGKEKAVQRHMLKPAVDDLIERSVAEFKMRNSISTFSPVFGQNTYPIQEKLVFVLMPFEQRLTEIYNAVIRPAIENDLKLVCRRADEITGSNPIMQDIWKSICEAQYILDDLTNFNPNVMYELGIPHTVGKSTVLIYQDGDATSKFPFDLAHIRRINYQNTMPGGVKLREDLVATMTSLIQFRV